MRELFTAAPDVLHPGEGARILEPVVGRNSVILLDEGAHLEQRKLMLPAFHGEQMQRLTGLMSEVTEREVERWPRGEPVALHPRLQRADARDHPARRLRPRPGPAARAPARALTGVLEFGDEPGVACCRPLQRGAQRPRAAWRRFVRTARGRRAELFELIDERRAEAAERDDMLAHAAGARHEDGSPMPTQELRDELMTLLVAGHETTASSLAFAFERSLVRPRCWRGSPPATTRT